MKERRKRRRRRRRRERERGKGLLISQGSVFALKGCLLMSSQIVWGSRIMLLIAVGKDSVNWIVARALAIDPSPQAKHSQSANPLLFTIVQQSLSLGC